MISGLLADMGTDDPSPAAATTLGEGLRTASDRMVAMGVPVPAMEGKLLRPLFALAMVPRDRWARLDERFWSGALAIQMVHEASLIHDDVVDGARERRGRPTLFAIHGTGAAVVQGDHYLTGAYRAAALTGSFEFVGRFTEAVEQTVAGEVMQARAAGERTTPEEYDAAITRKSGELFGIAGVLGATAAELGDLDIRYDLGRSFGNLYQRIDDLLDYCSVASTGKPPLQDYRQKKWSWVLDLAGVDGYALTDDEIVTAIFEPGTASPSPARRALEVLADRQRQVQGLGRRVGVCEETLGRLLGQCMRAATEGVRLQEQNLVVDSEPTRPAQVHGLDGAALPEPPVDAAATARQERHIREAAAQLGGREQWRAYFGEHARTFHLAARLFPPREAGLVAGLYAYCRFTDDLVDDPVGNPTAGELATRLAVWRSLSMAAWDGETTGIALLDTVMAEAVERDVARLYPEALLDGVGMDLRPRAYPCWGDLERYTFGVASAVGGWMSQLFGVHDPKLLERAHALGHAMQLTNIARDVGEDWRNGRLYLPIELLDSHGLTCEHLESMINDAEPLSDEYRAAVRDLISRADAYYEVAWPGIRALPPFFRRPVAAAASAYRGIHREIRRNGYDNVNHRAHTSMARKLMLAGAGVVEARRAS